MNVYDSDRMSDALAPLGYAPTDMPEGADMVILNTCHIRERASEKVFSERIAQFFPYFVDEVDELKLIMKPELFLNSESLINYRRNQL